MRSWRRRLLQNLCEDLEFQLGCASVTVDWFGVKGPEPRCKFVVLGSGPHGPRAPKFRLLGFRVYLGAARRPAFRSNFSLSTCCWKPDPCIQVVSNSYHKSEIRIVQGSEEFDILIPCVPYIILLSYVLQKPFLVNPMSSCRGAERRGR